MKRTRLSIFVLSSTLVSIATVYPTDLPARDKSSGGASVSAGGVSVSTGGGGASVSAGGVSVSADRGGASVSGGGGSVSADRGGASVSGGTGSVSADRGGASVSGGTGSVGADRGEGGMGSDDGGNAPAVLAPTGSRAVGDRSYGSIGEWFDDLRSSWFGGRSNAPGGPTTTTTSSSTTQTKQTSESGGTQINRVVQEKTAIATEGGSAEASNVNRTEQRMD